MTQLKAKAKQFVDDHEPLFNTLACVGGAVIGLSALVVITWANQVESADLFTHESGKSAILVTQRTGKKTMLSKKEKRPN